MSIVWLLYASKIVIFVLTYFKQGQSTSLKNLWGTVLFEECTSIQLNIIYYTVDAYYDKLIDSTKHTQTFITNNSVMRVETIIATEPPI